MAVSARIKSTSKDLFPLMQTLTQNRLISCRDAAKLVRLYQTTGNYSDFLAGIDRLAVEDEYVPIKQIVMQQLLEERGIYEQN